MKEQQVNKQRVTKKHRYRKPVLQTYGEIRNLTQSTGSANGDGGQGMMPRSASDRRVKENIVRVGTHSLGISIYLFDYKPEYRDIWGHGRQFGVMADEVERVMPEAVSVHPEGYKMINYALLETSDTPR